MPVRAIVLLAFAFVSAASKPASAQISVAHAQALVALHDAERCAVDPTPAAMPPLDWDPLLANVAQGYASACNLGIHNGSRHTRYAALGGSGYVGENLAWGTARAFSVVDLAQLWADEKALWRYGPVTSGNLSGVGHYTQMIWANTTRVGCGAASCSGTLFLVCNYAPAGNYLNQAPYAVGSGPNQACGNQAPIANAGPDQVASAGVTVVLDGSESTDPDDDSLAYAWQQTAGPAVTLDAVDTAQPSFTAPPVAAIAMLAFELAVDDGTAASAPDSVTVEVHPVPEAGAVLGGLAVAGALTGLGAARGRGDG